ncbi:MAG TPA: AmmeMemoRadiSam system protein B [Candidatus Acidoferrales bacterium]|nr:AmmeMemoRadiSam system protein B [Candidatus Acidoferrales bacterium]
MKKIFYGVIFLFLAGSCKGEKPAPSNYQTDSIRQPVFAGKFYPADSTKLTSAIKSFLRDAKPAEDNKPIAIIVPHAGYIYAGQIMADGYNQVRQNQYDMIVVLGTNHTTAGFSGISVYPKGAFGTPIGPVEVDDKAAGDLIREDPDVTANLAVHAQEHSIEVQIPFVKYLFPHAKILPIIVGEPDIKMCTKFGQVLAKILKGKKALIVASSDLSHYPRFDDAIKVDARTLRTIVALDLEETKSVMDEQLEQNIPQLVTCACGEAPILAAMAAAKELGANCASIVSYSNSGYNPVGSSDRTVGYGSVEIGIGRPTPPADPDTLMINPSYTLSPSDKKELLNYARKTLEQYFSTATVPLPRGLNPLLKVKRGAFVTLTEHGDLRGCIGQMRGDRPLSTTVGSMALQAAFNDTRFNPLTEQELPQVEIEISVLTPLTQVKNADEIVLGRDGVIVRKGDRQAVFLPQVATETGWSKEVFLDQLCLKAGLEAGDWKDAELFTFQADVFSESQFH